MTGASASPVGDGPEPDTATVQRLYRALFTIRRVEERIAAIYPSDKIKSPIHLSIGQEAISVGVCDVLRDDDVVSGTYRCHAAYLAKGGSLGGMLAELFGKATGSALGKGGSMHLVSREKNVIGASAVVGTNIPIAVGHALAARRRAEDRVVACFFGDGATEEGVFYESLNFAALHRLPVLFVCENNGYAIHEPLDKRWATKRLKERVETFGIPTCSIPDQDVFRIRELAAAAILGMRAGGGPEFMECHAYRWREHVGPNEDYEAGYRSRSEAEPWIAGDQVARLALMLDHDDRERIDAAVEAEIDEAVAFAEVSPPPKPGELYDHVFAD